MANFSIGEAVGAGFQVIRRKPVVLLAWAAAYLLVMGVPYYLLMRPILPEVIGVYQGMAGAAVEGAAPDSSAMMAMQQKMFGVMPVIWLLSLVTISVLVGAIYRAVLTPEDSRYFYLRLSRQELWLGVTCLAFMVLCVVVRIVAMIPVGIVSAFVMVGVDRGGGAGPLAALAVPLLMIAAYVFILWILLRLSMAFPMSFAEGRFALFRSWEFTKGHAWKMFLVALSVALILAVVEVIFLAVWCAVLAAAAGGDLHTLIAMPPEELLARLGPVLIGTALVGSVLGMAIYTIAAAPWASIYKQLTADDIPV